MYFTLSSVLLYFEGFKLALFNVIFYPKLAKELLWRNCIAENQKPQEEKKRKSPNHGHKRKHTTTTTVRDSRSCSDGWHNAG